MLTLNQAPVVKAEMLIRRPRACGSPLPRARYIYSSSPHVELRTTSFAGSSTLRGR